MSDRDETVLGFKNTETAMVLLWLENERPIYDQARAVTAEVAEQLGEDEAPAVTLGDQLRELIEEADEVYAITGPDAEQGHAADLIGCALGRVDWRELGAHFLAVHGPEVDA